MPRRSESQVEPGGNTKAPGQGRQKQAIQAYRWFITLKEDPVEPIEPKGLAKLLSEFCKEWTFQLERGEGGFLHWQMEISLLRKHRLNEVKNLIGRSDVHLEPTKNYFAAQKYCSKAESRVAGPWTEKSVWIDTIQQEQLHDWQRVLEAELCGPVPKRKIVWYTDFQGGAGKTEFTKYMIVKHAACGLNNAKTADIAYAIKEDVKIVIFNLARTLEGKVNYQAIEQVKDGLIFSAKYESTTKVFNSPHLVVFANFNPDLDALSKDRWDIRVLS